MKKKTAAMVFIPLGVIIFTGGIFMNKTSNAGKVGHAVEKAVVSGYQAVENAVVTGYNAVEKSVVGAYKKIEDKFVDTFLADADPRKPKTE